MLLLTDILFPCIFQRCILQLSCPYFPYSIFAITYCFLHTLFLYILMFTAYIPYLLVIYIFFSLLLFSKVRRWFAGFSRVYFLLMGCKVCYSLTRSIITVLSYFSPTYNFFFFLLSLVTTVFKGTEMIAGFSRLYLLLIGCKACYFVSRSIKSHIFLLSYLLTFFVLSLVTTVFKGTEMICWVFKGVSRANEV